MSAAAVSIPGHPCPICGDERARDRDGKWRATCGDRECVAAKKRLTMRATVADRNAGGVTPSGWRQALGVRQLAELVEADRTEHGELAYIIEWPPGTCPRERGDSGPCIHVGCRHHRCGHVAADGALWVDPRFEADPYLVPTCELDGAPRADGDGLTLQEVGEGLGVTRERVRQIEAKGLMKLRGASRRAALEDFADLIAGRPSTPLGAVQGLGPSCGGGRLYGYEVPRPGPGLCRHVEAPHAAPQPARRRLYSLPPSLLGHEAELCTPTRRDRRHGSDCTRAEAAGLLELRPGREDCDTDGDEAAAELAGDDQVERDGGVVEGEDVIG